MLKMIVSDIDGTLVKSGDPLDPEIFRLIRFFGERGVRFCACSGRPLSNLLRLFAPVRDEICCIAENGTLCWADGELNCYSHVDREFYRDVMRKALATPDCDILLATRDMSYTQTQNEAYIHYVRDVIDYDLTVVDDILNLPVDPVKIAICNFNGIENSFDDFFREFSEGPLSVVTSGNIWLDMIPKEINKGYTLRLLLEKLSIDPKDTIAFGDQFNDVEMLTLAGKSYAVETCAKGVEKYADALCKNPIEVLKKLEQEYLENEK